MIAVSTQEEWDFVLPEERGTESATTFRLRPLPLRVRDEAVDLLTRRGTAEGIPFGTFSTLVLRSGLVGWTNFKTAKGAEVAFGVDRNGKVRDDLLERIPHDAALTIANEVMFHSQLTEADRKN
jgi:hypothetical protein